MGCADGKGGQGRIRGRGDRGAAQRHVPRQARQRSHRPRSRRRQDAPLSHPHPSRRPHPLRALSLRPGPGADRLPPSLSSRIAERSLIDSIASELAGAAEAEAGVAPGRTGGVDAGSRVLRGIGDDAAVVLAHPVCVVSVDAMVDGTHFRLEADWTTPAQVGRRALAGALSDLAAMGADAGEAYLVLGLPAGFSEQHALELVRGAKALAVATGTTIAGG